MLSGVSIECHLVFGHRRFVVLRDLGLLPRLNAWLPAHSRRALRSGQQEQSIGSLMV